LDPPFQGDNLNHLAAKIQTEPQKKLELYSDSLNTFALDTLLHKDADRRPYVN
jgi:hypothetical protein